MGRLTLQEWIKEFESEIEASELANYLFREEIKEGVVKEVSQEILNKGKQKVEWLKELQRYKDLEEQGRLIEQKHGRWKVIGENRFRTIYKCSACGVKYDFTPLYCPNCGAKMELKELEGDKE